MDYKGLKELLEGCISDKAEEFPAELDSLIADTARTGIVRLPWDLLKPLFNYRLKKVLVASFDELALEGEDKALHQQLLDQLNKFDNPPFTIQRVCELIVEPTKHYKKRDRYMRAMERCLLVVSTQEPDLTWMKSPRLTQLLEEPPKESLQEVVFDEDMVNEYAAVPASGSTANLWSNLRQITTNDDSEQPSSPSESDQSTTTIKATKPVSPASREKEEKGEEASTSTAETMDDKSSTTSANSASLMDDDDGFEDNTPESSSNSPERGDAEDKKPPIEGAGQFPLSRKRSSSMRDSMEGSGSEGGGGGEREEDARGTVLQEADSTTLGGEHDDNGRDEGMEGGGAAEAGEEGRSQEEEEEADRDLEQSTPKKRRSKSPEIETKSSSLEGDRLDNLNIVDAKATVSDTVVAGGELEKMESSQDALESDGSLSLKKRLQPSLVESEEEGEGGGRGSEREEMAAIAELHSSSGDEGEMRETSTGQLERSHDAKTDSAVSLASEQMETAP